MPAAFRRATPSHPCGPLQGFTLARRSSPLPTNRFQLLPSGGPPQPAFAFGSALIDARVKPHRRSTLIVSRWARAVIRDTKCARLLHWFCVTTGEMVGDKYYRSDSRCLTAAKKNAQ